MEAGKVAASGLKYSFIIPVYNRPEELRELLGSFAAAGWERISGEIIVWEDGSTLPSSSVVEAYCETLHNLRYEAASNGGPATARNRASQIARGEYLIFLDSDVLLPEGYLEALEEALGGGRVSFFGAPDAAAPSFSPLQKSINYAMTSPLTTGGIRGASKTGGMERFKPRSYNMGVLREAFLHVGGFDEGLRFGEDIDLSLRLIEAGYQPQLLQRLWVYHKRRIDLKKFFRQVFNSGAARVALEERHPGSTRLVHLLPFLFTLVVLLSPVLLIFMPKMVALGAIIFYLLLALDAFRRERLWQVALLAPIAAFIQLTGYGLGFLIAWVNSKLLGRRGYRAFDKTFYS